MEKERLYVIRCGKGYVRFNLDGTMIACRYSNAITNENHMRKLPFNIAMAEASGIIKIEEVNLYSNSKV